jgi:hypothetical protein
MGIIQMAGDDVLATRELDIVLFPSHGILEGIVAFSRRDGRCC